MSDATSADAGTDSATPVISVRPVTLAAPNRGPDLQVRVSAPTTARAGDDAWPAAREALAATSGKLGRIDSK